MQQDDDKATLCAARHVQPSASILPFAGSSSMTPWLCREPEALLNSNACWTVTSANSRIPNSFLSECAYWCMATSRQ
jgi:hypothetical protein